MILKNVWCLDLETTGVDTAIDRIVEIALVNLSTKEKYHQRINPGVSIPKGASDVHGITNKDVAHLPGFSTHSGVIRELIDGKVLLGYNIKQFDLPLLLAEYARLNHPAPTFEAVIDSMLWMRKENKRTLEWTYNFYTGNILEDAHGALNDVEATIEIFHKQYYEHLEPDEYSARWLEDYIRAPYLDDGAKFLKLDDGRTAITFGKFATNGPVAIEDLNRGYIAWMLKNFNKEEVEIIEAALPNDQSDY